MAARSLYTVPAALVDQEELETSELAVKHTFAIDPALSSDVALGAAGLDFLHEPAFNRGVTAPHVLGDLFDGGPDHR